MNLFMEHLFIGSKAKNLYQKLNKKIYQKNIMVKKYVGKKNVMC